MPWLTGKTRALKRPTLHWACHRLSSTYRPQDWASK